MIWFNAVHAPIGAHSAFTLGHIGKTGGFSVENGKSADENVFVAIESAEHPGCFRALPFWEPSEDEAARFDHQNAATGTPADGPLTTFAPEEVSREFKLGSDRFRAGDLELTIYSRVLPLADPESADPAVLASQLCPAVIAELTIDNRRGTRERRGLFGFQSEARLDNMRRLANGIASGQAVAVTTDAPAELLQNFNIERILDLPDEVSLATGLGNCGVLRFCAAPGERAVFRLAFAFHRAGVVTTGEPMSYYYWRFFPDLESVGDYALTHFEEWKEESLAADRVIEQSRLSPERAFQLIHAVRSYYASTQLFDCGGRAVWVVNEGEYRMLNTFDLTIDQLFFELRMNPWTVRNELERFVERYSYVDRYGISFTHDMGVRNHFTPPGFSSYECPRLPGCFSYMTREQLVNWALAAATYCLSTGETRWSETFALVFQSMRNRADDDGLLVRNSDRCGKDGIEITTYDSLDESLGQADGNLYLAVKTWAAYLALAEILPDPAPARELARRSGLAINRAALADGTIPSILDRPDSGKIIPAIEGLIFPYFLGLEA
ncbi:MAG: glycoside hydrolase family 52 protein, partial [Victivallaceae bacterium]